ncbi:unnamed protein product [Adineta ricciae]|uniref:Uncharacterized protein n=1 Tax=Adineta ricciae TaxID=249248 RepID=A0A814MD27_ADIRI|nr:unnamed protein product [Adineta ricciae]
MSKRTAVSIGASKRTKRLDSKYSVKPSDESMKKDTLFVWVDKNVNENQRIQTSIKQLELSFTRAIVTDDSQRCKQWLKKYSGDENIFLIVSNALLMKVLPHIHSLSAITRVYTYGPNRTGDDRWAKNYPKVRKMAPNIKQLVEAISMDLKDVQQRENMKIECVHQHLTRSIVSRDYEKKPTKDDKEGVRSITNFQFILIDVTKNLNEHARAMLNALISMTPAAIRVFDDGLNINFQQLPDQPTFLFVSNAFAGTMDKKAKQFEGVYILTGDEDRVDHRTRFENSEDLIFQLADEIYRCYIKEADQYLNSGNSLTAEIKKQQANQVHSNVKRAYTSVCDHQAITYKFDDADGFA